MQIRMEIEDLYLLVIYLNGWIEHVSTEPDIEMYKSWNGYNPDILDKLETKNLICRFRNSRMMMVTKSGLKHARQIKSRFRIEKPPVCHDEIDGNINEV